MSLFRQSSAFHSAVALLSAALLAYPRPVRSQPAETPPTRRVVGRSQERELLDDSVSSAQCHEDEEARWETEGGAIVPSPVPLRRRSPFADRGLDVRDAAYVRDYMERFVDAQTRVRSPKAKRTKNPRRRARHFTSPRTHPCILRGVR